jgi:hypothetical protein
MDLFDVAEVPPLATKWRRRASASEEVAERVLLLGFTPPRHVVGGLAFYAPLVGGRAQPQEAMSWQRFTELYERAQTVR